MALLSAGTQCSLLPELFPSFVCESPTSCVSALLLFC
jgi:hypothetical protein